MNIRILPFIEMLKCKKKTLCLKSFDYKNKIFYQYFSYDLLGRKMYHLQYLFSNFIF